MKTIGSLFSGIGGLELGLEWSGLGRTVWQCEIDPFCRQVLAKHWPGVPCHEDVRAIGAANLARPDVLCGGFPCQDVSSAGKGAGVKEGTRSGLWFEFRRIASELRPPWIIVENVASGARRWVCLVRGDLESRGYRTRALGIAASDVGAPHRRKRIFIVAHLDGIGCHGRPWAGEERPGVPEPSDSRPVAYPDGQCVGAGRPWGTASCAEGREPEAQAGTSADADGCGIRIKSRGRERQGRGGSSEPGNDGTPRDAASYALQPGRSWTGAPTHTGRTGSPEDAWGSPVPDVLRMVHGVPGRVDRSSRPRIRALGNSVVPPVRLHSGPGASAMGTAAGEGQGSMNEADLLRQLRDRPRAPNVIPLSPDAFEACRRFLGTPEDVPEQQALRELERWIDEHPQDLPPGIRDLLAVQ